MLIGIISDTHDDMEQIKKAVIFFNRKGVGLVLHAGDIVSPFTFEYFRDLVAEFAGIFGNNDGDKLLVREKSGGRVFNQPYIKDVGGKKLALMHEPDFLEAIAESGEFDIIIYGHLHRPDIRQIGKTLVINPGKAARLHKGQSTVALLDTDQMKAEIITL